MRLSSSCFSSQLKMRPHYRMANDWIEALKVWNKQRNAGMWCVPKKDTTEHSEVLAIMALGRMPSTELR